MKKFPIYVLSVAAIIIVFFFYSLCILKYSIKVEETIINSLNIPSSFDGVRLIQFSDLHLKNEEDLVKHLEDLEEAKRRDHKKLGRELELFMISEYGPGFPFFLPKGMILRNELENFWYKEHTKEGYQFIKTPIMLNKELWELSGHWYNYRENMYTSEIDEKTFAIKPMNCPGGMLVYKNSLHS